MIRWYDYVLAVLAADFMTGFLIAGANATTWWQPLLFGMCAGIVWQIWNTDYCAFRLRQESKR